MTCGEFSIPSGSGSSGMSRARYVLTLLLAVGLVSCAKQRAPRVAGVTDTNATAIVVDHTGALVDFVTVSPTQGLDRIEFLAPSSGEQITVYAVGPNTTGVSPLSSVSSRQAPGLAGKVIVEIEDGCIQLISGNSISLSDPPSGALLQRVVEVRESGAHARPQSTVLVYMDAELSSLVEDASGSLAPPDMTPCEREFLDRVVPAIRAKNLASLTPLIHRRTGDSSGINTVEKYLEVLLSHDMSTYQFMRVDVVHPDNALLVQENSSLPVRWILTVKFRKASPFTHCDLKVGAAEGKLMLPTTYGRPRS
jgi:hypothetical protein